MNTFLLVYYPILFILAMFFCMHFFPIYVKREFLYA